MSDHEPCECGKTLGEILNAEFRNLCPLTAIIPRKQYQATMYHTMTNGQILCLTGDIYLDSDCFGTIHNIRKSVANFAQITTIVEEVTL